jgi:hypothetical protein
MKPQRWKEIDDIFAAALERDSAERPAFSMKPAAAMPSCGRAIADRACCAG